MGTFEERMVVVKTKSCADGLKICEICGFEVVKSRLF